MKKAIKTLLAVACVAAVGVSALALTACGGNEPVTVKTSYICSDKIGDSMAQYTTYKLDLMSDNTYVYTVSGLTWGFSMNLGTTTTVTYGTYTVAAAEDGVCKVTLSKATDVVLNSFSKAGGFHISINSFELTEADYTAGSGIEVPATQQGEKEYVKSKEELINKYGTEKTVWISEGAYIADGTFNNELFLADPNA